MESRVNYSLVGLFVLLLGACGIIIPLWLSSGLDKQQYETYRVYMNEAVDGLLTNAAVNYNGVDVGYVKNIKLNSKNTEQVELLLNIKTGTPITTHTKALLESQGVTGVAYIGLKGGILKDALPLIKKHGQAYAEIKAAPSIRVRLDTALTQIINNTTVLSHRLENILNPENTKLFNQILNNLNKTTRNLSRLSENSDQIDILLQNFSQLSQNMPEIADQLHAVLNNIQMITKTVKQNPSIVLRGQTSALPGPGEEK